MIGVAKTACEFAEHLCRADRRTTSCFSTPSIAIIPRKTNARKLGRNLAFGGEAKLIASVFTRILTVETPDPKNILTSNDRASMENQARSG